uniref:Uncharacterized protein n=1 Tax=Timema monikensis TaxID=170555 RepID=A0A7R9HTF6_9NEOP|nr:unnamed protein product [Timema monikensis]
MRETTQVIKTFDEEDAVSTREAKVATSSSTVVTYLANVKSYFGNLPGVIVSLEARDLPLIESVKIMHTIQEGVKQTPGPVASSVATKLEQISNGTHRICPDVLGSDPYRFNTRPDHLGFSCVSLQISEIYCTRVLDAPTRLVPLATDSPPFRHLTESPGEGIKIKCSPELLASSSTRSGNNVLYSPNKSFPVDVVNPGSSFTTFSSYRFN